MTNSKNEAASPDIPALEKEGEKVTGGTDSEASETPAEETSKPESGNSGEISPQEESKKEDMTGYNEHPDQDKVGGG